PAPDHARGSAGRKSWNPGRACAGPGGELRHGRGAKSFASTVDLGERPEARRAASDGRSRFFPGANGRDWRGCAGGFCCLRASLRGGGWRAGSCGGGRSRCTCEQEITTIQLCQDTYELETRTFPQATLKQSEK